MNSTISIPSPQPGEGGNSTVIIIAVVVPITVFFLLFVAVFSFRTNRKKTIYETEPLAGDGNDITTAGSLQFDFKAIESATDKFSESNKLGQGGFGQVYKGSFPNGVQVAVKRLSKTSGQGEEKILVYEFVPNKSLDYFLFDSTMQRQLDWTRRYKIIESIDRGILYLH
ncbi:Cysteine-rich receptor-like protein kinase 19 [Cardamine amara subsp. amara]|uniref:Cysteine-rich receptor-like protein kinase 19 n=1 Tax=Cardamine amara subsp. amara TaxID=228776 RepID=A0ABD1BH94_CARAN